MGDTINLILNWRSVMLIMALLPLLISLAVLIVPKPEKSARLYLAAFFFCIVLSAGPQIIGYASFYDLWPGLTYFPLFYVTLWFGPLLYLHGYKLMHGGALGWRKYLLLPGVLQIVYYIWAFFGLGSGWADYQAKWAYNGAVHQPFIVPLETFLSLGLLLFALIAVWRLMKAYTKYLESTQSQAIDFDPIWLKRIILGTIIGGLVYLIGEIASLFNPGNFRLFFIFQLAVLLITAWLAIEAVFRLNQSFPKMQNIGQAELSVAVVQETQKTNPELSAQADLARTIKGKVLSEKWFLESQISIRDLAKRLGTNESYISRALNQDMGQSFNQFINALRVEHAKGLISDGEPSMLDIALDSGFNSKATFNRVFRSMAGQTPSAFKKSQNA